MTKKPQHQKNNKKNPYVKMTALGVLCVLGIGILAFYVCAKMMGDSIYYTLYRRYDKSAAYEDTAHGLILHSRTHKPFTGVIVLQSKPPCANTTQNAAQHSNKNANAHQKDFSDKADATDKENPINETAHKAAGTAATSADTVYPQTEADSKSNQAKDTLNTNPCPAQGVSKKEIFIKNGQIRGEKVYNTQTGKLCRETFFDYDGHFKYSRSYGPDCSYLETEEIFKKDANVVLFYNAKGQKTVKAFIENDRFTHGFCYEGFGQTIKLTEDQLERLNRWDTSVTCR